MAQPALPYRCPVLRIDFLQRPCEKNLKRAEVLRKAAMPRDFLDLCAECQGKKLEVKDLEASRKLKAFCPVHPEQRLEILDKPRNGPKRILMTRCALCEAAAKTPETPAMRYCKNHLDQPDYKNTGLCLKCLQERAVANSRNRKGRKAATAPNVDAPAGKPVPPTPAPPAPPNLSEYQSVTPLLIKTGPEGVLGIPTCKKHPEIAAVIDRLGRSMGLCAECLSERGRISGIGAHERGLTGPPVSIPLNQGKYTDLRAWLEEQAAENERTLNQEIIYRLKMARRQAEIT